MYKWDLALNNLQGLICYKIGALENMKYPFIAITPMSTLIQIDSTC